MRDKVILVLVVFLFVFTSGACSPNVSNQLSQDEIYKIELIKEIQEFEKNFGFKETDNFKYYDSEVSAYHLYYYTEKTILPYSYEDPRLHCRGFTQLPEDSGIDPNEYDIFYYEAEAVAEIGTPITPALLEASLDRMIVVVIHEDFHEQIDFPSGIEEPIVTLVGCLVALEFAEVKFGKDSDIYKKMEKELEIGIGLSPIYIKYYQLLSELYLNYQMGEFSEEETLAEKENLLKAMEEDLQEALGRESRYPLNNAYVAFEMTYSRYYPPVYEVYLATDKNLLETIEIFKTIPIEIPWTRNLEETKKIEKEIADYLEETIKMKEPAKVGSFCCIHPLCCQSSKMSLLSFGKMSSGMGYCLA